MLHSDPSLKLCVPARTAPSHCHTFQHFTFDVKGPESQRLDGWALELQQLRFQLWRHSLHKRRSWVQTSIEVLSPVFIMVSFLHGQALGGLLSGSGGCRRASRCCLLSSSWHVAGQADKAPSHFQGTQKRQGDRVGRDDRIKNRPGKSSECNVAITDLIS